MATDALRIATSRPGPVDQASPAPPFEAFFARPGRSGQRLCVHTPATGALRGAVLHLHAFAEEMNKSRRMVARSARALASAGFAVLQIDLLGCGDSDAEFADARWSEWLADAAWAASWLERHYDAPLWLWGHRAGALLAGSLAAERGRDCHLLFWNPVLQGKAIAQQFLRLKAAAEWAQGDGKAAIEGAKAELAAGRVVEIAGYGLHPQLVGELDRLALAPPAGPAIEGLARDAQRLVWLEVGGRAGDASLSPAAVLQVQKWRAAGYRTQAQAVVGPAFWQTVEIEDAPALIDATVQALCAHVASECPA